MIIEHNIPINKHIKKKKNCEQNINGYFEDS